MSKLKIKEVEFKKPCRDTQLVKCYICSMHFSNQGQFESHMSQHQNKINRNTQADIQLKTAQSFRKPKQVMDKTALDKTATSHETEPNEAEEQQALAEALKESVVLVEKMQFLTQPLEEKENVEQCQAVECEEEEIIQKIYDEKQLLSMLSKSRGKDADYLILQTHFYNDYMQNYQSQLYYLRAVARLFPHGGQPQMESIRTKICGDVMRELEQRHLEKKVLKGMKGRKAEEQNKSVLLCSQCYSQMGWEQCRFELACGHCYHSGCWSADRQCC